mgnify:CR=1 FL=1
MISLTEKYILNDPFVSAGSGLALHKDHFYVVADDELGILSLRADFLHKGIFHPVFPGKLPDEYASRKKLKPDIESIVVVGDDLLLIPSGSRPNRTQGALFSISNSGPRVVSFKNVYAQLEKEFPELNIEGAVILDDRIRLFQRGNGKLLQNAVIDLHLLSFLNDEVKDLKIIKIELGKLNETPLSFTDAALSDNTLYFLAAAEKTESTYDDGEFAGAVLGKMDLSGQVIKCLPLNISSKPEGLCIKGTDFFIVTDDDDRKKASRIFSGSLGPFFID